MARRGKISLNYRSEKRNNYNERTVKRSSFYVAQGRCAWPINARKHAKSHAAQKPSTVLLACGRRLIAQYHLI